MSPSPNEHISNKTPTRKQRSITSTSSPSDDNDEHNNNNNNNQQQTHNHNATMKTINKNFSIDDDFDDDEDDIESDESDVTKPILNTQNYALKSPSFRFGQTSLSPSVSPPSSSSRHSKRSIALNLRPPDSSSTSPNQSDNNTSEQQQQQRRLCISPYVLAIIIAAIVLLVTDSMTGILSVAFTNVLGGTDSSTTSTTNNITSTSTTSNGIPPRSLSPNNPQSVLLTELRSQTQLTPRWPLSSGADVARLRTYGPAYASMIICHSLRVVYIPVFKVATTSTMYLLAYLENNRAILDAVARGDGSHMSLLHDMGSAAWKNHTVYNMKNEDLEKILNDPTYLKFGFVRNPFDRLVSAYVDKVVRPDFQSYEYRTQMHSLYGDDNEKNEMKKKFSNGTRPTFSQFVKAASKVLKKQRVRSEDLTNADAYENNDSRRDLHWRPQNELLHSDLVHIDFVGKYDSMETDREKVLQWIYRYTNRRMEPKAERKLHTSDPQLKAKLLQQLESDDDLRNIILNMYQDDFRRFHFSTKVPKLDQASENEDDGED